MSTPSFEQQPQQPPYQPVPAPPLRPEDERTWAILVHLLPLVGVSFLGPLVVWLVFRGRGPFLEHHAKESLNFQLTVLIALLVSLVAVAVTFGIVVFAPFAVYLGALVLQVLAAVAASRWEWYRYPVTIRFVS